MSRGERTAAFKAAHFRRAVRDVELHLYLDSHPYCKEAAKKLTAYREEYDKLTAEYEKAYGPLNETSRSTSRWAWISDPWPWETEANE